MAPGYQVDELSLLQKRLAEVEAELEAHRQRDAQAEQRFREVLDLSPVMIWTADTDAMCTFLNRAWLEFRGRAMEQEVGNGWTEGLHPDDRDICLEGYVK